MVDARRCGRDTRVASLSVAEIRRISPCSFLPMALCDMFPIHCHRRCLVASHVILHINSNESSTQHQHPLHPFAIIITTSLFISGKRTKPASCRLPRSTHHAFQTRTTIDQRRADAPLAYCIRRQHPTFPSAEARPTPPPVSTPAVPSSNHTAGTMIDTLLRPGPQGPLLELQGPWKIPCGVAPWLKQAQHSTAHAAKRARGGTQRGGSVRGIV